jgi:hypothetical protein
MAAFSSRGADENSEAPAPAAAPDADDRRSTRARSSNRFATWHTDQSPRASAPRRGAPGSRDQRSRGHRDENSDAVHPQFAQDTDGPKYWPNDGSDGPGSRELVLVPDHTVPAGRGATYMVRPDAFPSRQDEYYRDPPVPPRALGRKILIAGAIVTQVVVVILAGAAFYVAMWGPTGRLAVSPPAAQDVADATPAHLPAKVPPRVIPALRADPSDEFAPAEALATGATAAIAPTAVAAAPAFPRPSAYGVYAISDNRLIELEQASTAPVDPRARTSLQIVKPSRTIITEPKLTFVAYRRDLTTNAPDKVPIRVAARIAKQMTFDGSGKSVTAPPPTETWLIRDQGYDLRVSPMRESSEMVLLRPESEEFAFPPGRYELLLSGQAYDFVIAGNITDPAQCVEGVATARGPAFYECRAP